jgi:hypothetical protein
MDHPNNETPQANNKKGFSFTRELPYILISATIGILLAFIFSMFVLDIPNYGFRYQVFILGLFAFVFSVFCYFLITRSSIRSSFKFSFSNQPGWVSIRRIFLAIFFLFPICLILYEQIEEFLRILSTGQSSVFIGWLPLADSSRVWLILSFMLSSLFIFAVFIADRKQSTRNFFDRLADAWYILFVLFASILIRIPIIHAITTQPTSDFGLIQGDALTFAQGGLPVNMYVTTHVVVTLIYGLIYRIFSLNLNAIKIFHAIAYAIAGMFLYGALRKLIGSKLWSATAALLLVGWPSLAIYSNVLTPEHLFILTECALIFVVAHFFQYRDNSEFKTHEKRLEKYLIWSIIVGLLIGVTGFFRPFGELFLVAFIIMLLTYTRSLKAVTVSLIFLLTSFMLVRNIPTALARHYHNPIGNIRPCNLLIGMNFQTDGQYNPDDYRLCLRLNDRISDNSEFRQRIFEIVKERFLKQKAQLIPFIFRKFSIIYANSNGILFWAARKISGGDQNFVLNVLKNVNLMDVALMLIITISMVIGTVIAFIKDVKPVLFFCLLTFFGFNLMEVVLEVQTRYRTVMMPILILFSCWTFAFLSSRMNERKLDFPNTKA